MNKKEAGCLVHSSAFARIFGMGLFTWAGPFGWAVLIPLFHLGLNTFGPTKWTSMTQLPWVFIPHGLLLLVDIKFSLGFDRYL